MELTQSRAEFRDRFKIAAPPEEGPEAPLNFSRGVEETMRRLVTNLSARASPVEALRDAFKELKAQNSASLGAMRAAFDAVLERIDPKELEERFERAAKRSVFGSPNKAKYWDLYVEMFPGLSQRPVDGFPHFYSEAFAKAYEARLRALVPPRRGAFAADRGTPRESDGEAVGDY
jgi:type VI secretion system protein ImpI/type VI secretion system protein